jgi:site-specific DNA-methyltransferase (adenine-specific)
MKQEIWLGDCLELMKNIPDKSVDMILCDLPYGTTACKWDSIIDLNLLWESYNRVIFKNGAIILFGMQPFTTKLIYSNISKYKYSWIWKKSKASNFPHAPNMPLKICEDICVFSNGVVGHVSQVKDKRVPYNPQGIREGTTIVKQNPNTSELKYHRDSQSQHKDGYKCKAEGYPTTILDFKSENGLHPTQKPVSICEYLIKTYTDEGDLVLDNCAGSGSTLVAAKNLNRQFIGIEKEKEYYDICLERLK